MQSLTRAGSISLYAVASILFLTFAAHTAAAQVPPSAQPGIVTRNLEQPDRSRSRLEDTIVVPDMDEARAKGSTKKIFALKEIVLDNSSAYKTEDFKSVYGPYIGQDVSFADLNAIAQGMTRKYREDGFIFSRIVLPPQNIKNGVLHVQAVEGRITNVEVTGNFKDKMGLVAAFADKIRTAGPANTKEIERYLLLIDDLPGITARSFMKPSATPGGGDLIISVEQDLFEGSASFDNRGSRFIGPWRGELVGAFNSVFGIHDRTTLRALVATQTDELRFGEIMHEEQIGSEGMRLKGRYAVTKTEPGGSLSALGIEGDSDLFDIEALYPLLRGRQVNVNLLAGFTANNTETDLSGIQIAKDRVRSARAAARVDFADPLRGVNQLELMATKGLDVLNATPDGIGRSRANGEHEFLRYNATVTRIQDLWWNNVSLLLSGTWQHSSDPLLASEEFTVGGPGFGRAYDGGEIAGDRGYAGLAELRYGGAVDSQFVKSYQLYSFVDYGKVKNLSPVVGEVARDSLTSAGLGARFNLVHDLSGYIEWDVPLNKRVNAEGDDDSRFFFSALKRF
jgi:hemolysin activation/secretion protein